MKLYCPYPTCKYNDSDIAGVTGECTCDSIMLITVDVQEKDTQFLDCPRYVYDEKKELKHIN